MLKFDWWFHSDPPPVDHYQRLRDSRNFGGVHKAADISNAPPRCHCSTSPLHQRSSSKTPGALGAIRRAIDSIRKGFDVSPSPFSGLQDYGMDGAYNQSTPTEQKPSWGSSINGVSVTRPWDQIDRPAGQRTAQGISPQTPLDVRNSSLKYPSNDCGPQHCTPAAAEQPPTNWHQVITGNRGMSENPPPLVSHDAAEKLHVNRPEINPNRIAGLCQMLNIGHRNR